MLRRTLWCVASSIVVFLPATAFGHTLSRFQVTVDRQAGRLLVELSADPTSWAERPELPGLGDLGATLLPAYATLHRSAFEEVAKSALVIQGPRGAEIDLRPVGVEIRVLEGTSPPLRAPLVRLEGQDPGGDLWLRVSGFNPEQVGEAFIRWKDGGGEHFAQIAVPGSEALRESGSETDLWSFVRSGIHHILIGWDHLAFLLALIVAGRKILDVVKVATAFTIAHSITLLLSALDLIRLPSQPVEAAIAGSIVVAAGLNLLAPEARFGLYIAFVFGLVHGVGFSSALGEMLEKGSTGKTMAVAAFNLGVELGQVAVILVVCPLLLLWRRNSPAGYRQFGLRGISAGVAAVGLYWFLKRALP